MQRCLMQKTVQTLEESIPGLQIYMCSFLNFPCSRLTIVYGSLCLQYVYCMRFVSCGVVGKIFVFFHKLVFLQKDLLHYSVIYSIYLITLHVYYMCDKLQSGSDISGPLSKLHSHSKKSYFL
jgi:hypothetical protein